MLRGDDAAGAWVAATVARWRLSGVRVITAHQLTPELAEPLSQARLAIFVDARVGGGGVHVRPLALANTLSSLDVHIGDPGVLLALAQALYAHTPEAYLITIPARQFALGEPLSSLTRRALPAAYRRIRRLIMSVR